MARSVYSLLAAMVLVGGCGRDTATCSLDDPCPRGSFCLAGECRSECDPDTPSCPANEVCTSDGRCTHTQPDPEAGVCAAMVLEADLSTPTVTLLVDQSGSMGTTYSGNLSRWDVLRDALINTDTGVVTRLQGSMRFGLTLFTDLGTPTCPDLIRVPPALDNRDTIAATYETKDPANGTPTSEAIEAVTQDLVAYPEQGRKYLILATDGEPHVCGDNTADGGPPALAAVQAAFEDGITSYILSVGAEVISEQHLQDMANAGVGYEIGGTTNAPYYEAGDAQQLADAFDAITGGISTCDLMVNGTINPEAVETGVIYLDGNQLLLDDPNGWELIDQSSFRLLGSACSSAKRDGSHVVTAEFGCDASDAPALHASGGGAVDGGCASIPGVSLLTALALVALLGLRRR